MVEAGGEGEEEGGGEEGVEVFWDDGLAVRGFGFCGGGKGEAGAEGAGFEDVGTGDCVGGGEG